MAMTEIDHTPEPAPYPAAREWLDGVRVAAGRIEPLRRELVGLMEAREEVTTWKPKRGRGGSKRTHSDPTAAQAEQRMGELDALISDVQTRIDANEEVVGEALKIIERMRTYLGRRHGDALELYYVDRAQTWQEVAYELRVSPTTVWRLRVEAYAWVEAHCKLAGM